jgi:5-methylcytosine-specific restriction enzyme A
MSLFPRRCKHPTCAEDSRDPSGYCDDHRPARLARRADVQSIEQRAAAKRFYASPAWRELRARVLAERPLCELRLSGCWGRATQVDHKQSIEKGGAALAESNCQSACAHCHSIKTARSDGGFGFERARGRNA